MIRASLTLSKTHRFLSFPSTNSHPFSQYKKMKQAFYDFLNFQAGAIVRNAPQPKDRKYKHIEIAKQFQEIEKIRKRERLVHIQQRKELLQKKLETETKLLTENDHKKIGIEIQTLNQLLIQQEKELAIVDEKIQDTEAQYMLLTEVNKLVVINKIEYLKYIDRHPSGVFFDPQTLKTIENVHYLVTNNLPVERYKIYEIMPQMFEAEVSEVDNSKRRLITEKYLKADRKLDSDLQYFLRKQDPDDNDQSVITMQKLDRERFQVYNNLTMHVYDEICKHGDLLDKVESGLTIYRNDRHLFTVLMSGRLKLQRLTQQEKALQITLKEIMQMKQDVNTYSEQVDKLIHTIKYLPQNPPEYIQNHPVLLKHWQEVAMKSLTNPLPPGDEYLPRVDFPKVSELEIRIRKEVQVNFDPKFQELINTSNSEEERMEKFLAVKKVRGLYDHSESIPGKKRVEVDFYKRATQILQQLNLLQSEEEYFEKLPSKAQQNQLRSEESYIRLKTDEFTKMIWLNNKNKEKYNLAFFSNYFGIEQQILRSALESVSYLKFDIPKDMLKKGPSILGPTEGGENIQREVIRFQM